MIHRFKNRDLDPEPSFMGRSIFYSPEGGNKALFFTLEVGLLHGDELVQRHRRKEEA